MRRITNSTNVTLDGASDRLPEWHVEHTGDEAVGVIRDSPGEVADLERQSGGDVLVYGVGPVAATLLDHGLLDEIRLSVHPVLAGGRGQWADLLLRAGAVAHLDLAAHRALEPGVMLLTDRPKVAS
jgi:dihydrofolate reductase